MKIRSTERPHDFSKRLVKAIPIYSLQGLTLETSLNFTAGVEAVEYDRSEHPNFQDMFSKDEWIAKICICSQLSVPLYVCVYKSGSNHISIHEVILRRKENRVEFIISQEIQTKEFALWWAKLKGTKQSKPLYEARRRVSYFDELLEQSGLAWGGNIDGFTFDSKMNLKSIIETRYTEKIQLENYDPAVFFSPHFTRAGDYKTWEPIVLLASRLKIPLFLFTFERNSDEERIGFAVIESISKHNLKYQSTPPNQDIVTGIQNIRLKIVENYTEKPPEIL